MCSSGVGWVAAVVVWLLGAPLACCQIRSHDRDMPALEAMAWSVAWPILVLVALAVDMWRSGARMVRKWPW